MEVKLFNSLTNNLEVFKPLKEGKVSMYVCGPTVYSYPHIGNLRPVVTFDILRRLFEHLGYKVTYISNITDIDDKIIKAAIEEKVSEKDIASKYEKNFFDCCDKIHAKRPTHIPHATHTIPRMVEFISKLIKDGYAYEVDGDVYFRVTNIKDYGKLSHFQVENLKSGARIEENEKKENPLDFALWKKTEVGIKFPAPFGEGRPGWHTECVVMIQDYYPEGRIDIHGGGFDLKFPHHENEIAQAEAIFHHAIATYWLHNGFINIDNVKMSKSLGNVITAQSLLDDNGGNVVRMVMLSSHYRAPLNISQEILESAKKEVERIALPLKQVSIQLQNSGVARHDNYDQAKLAEFLEMVANDLNTANGLSVLYQNLKELNVASRQKDMDKVQILYNTIAQMLDVLGLEFSEVILSEEDKELYKKWEEYRKEKNFEKADEIRKLLASKGLV